LKDWPVRAYFDIYYRTNYYSYAQIIHYFDYATMLVGHFSIFPGEKDSIEESSGLPPCFPDPVAMNILLS
jgi:hypothetical protein